MQNSTEGKRGLAPFCFGLKKISDRLLFAGMHNQEWKIKGYICRLPMKRSCCFMDKKSRMELVRARVSIGEVSVE